MESEDIRDRTATIIVKDRKGIARFVGEALPTEVNRIVSQPRNRQGQVDQMKKLEHRTYSAIRRSVRTPKVLSD